VPGTKICFKCRKRQQRSAFYDHRAMADGKLGKCKGCTKTDVKKRYQVAIADRHEYEKTRSLARKPYRARAQKRYRQRHPERYAARTAVSNALRDGRLTRGACKGCGTKTRVQAHHNDYSKPLDVEWLCFKCHREDRHYQTVLTPPP
jgi:hypothetical protein